MQPAHSPKTRRTHSEQTESGLAYLHRRLVGPAATERREFGPWRAGIRSRLISRPYTPAGVLCAFDHIAHDVRARENLPHRLHSSVHGLRLTFSHGATQFGRAADSFYRTADSPYHTAGPLHHTPGSLHRTAASPCHGAGSRCRVATSCCCAAGGFFRPATSPCRTAKWSCHTAGCCCHAAKHSCHAAKSAHRAVDRSNRTGSSPSHAVSQLSPGAEQPLSLIHI